mgnify:CR=1 FL=1
MPKYIFNSNLKFGFCLYSSIITWQVTIIDDKFNEKFDNAPSLDKLINEDRERIVRDEDTKDEFGG